MDVSLLGAIKHNPLFFLLVLMLGVPALPIALVSVIMMLRRVAIARLLGFVAVGAAFLAFLVAVAGWLYGRHQVDVVLTLPALTEAERAALLAAGYAEARYLIWWGLAVAVPSMVFGAVAIFGTRAGEPDEATSQDEGDD